MTLVSIGVPVFNGMPYLPEAIESLLHQDHPHLEIVICDNASTDGTRDYCERVAGLDPRVSYYRFDENAGAAVNFQRCLDLSTGEYFAWLAHDDRLDRDYVSRCLGVLEQRPDAAMCTPAHRVIDEGGRVLDIRGEPRGLADRDLERRLRAHLWRRGWLTLYGLARRRYLKLVGPSSPVWGADVDLVWRLLLLAPILILDEPAADYRVFRGKTDDSILTGVTGRPSRVSWAFVGMRHTLRASTRRFAADPTTRDVADRVVNRWMASRYFREMIYLDLYVELRRLWQRGARLKAVALAPIMLTISPRLTARGVRLLWRLHREQHHAHP